MTGHGKPAQIMILFILGFSYLGFSDAWGPSYRTPCCLNEYNGILCEAGCTGEAITSQTVVCGRELEVNHASDSFALENVFRKLGKCARHLYLKGISVPILLKSQIVKPIMVPELEELVISDSSFVHEWNFDLLRTDRLSYFTVRNSALLVLSRSRFFSNSKSLKFFAVESSGLFLIENGFFKGLPILYLNLKGNRLTQIMGRMFQGRALQIMDLSDNDINYVDGMAFHDCTELAELDLSGNKIDSLPNYVFKSNAKLNNVKLSKNRIETVDFCALGFRLSRPYFSFYLEGNPLHCDTKQMNWLCAENCGSFLPDDTKNTRCVDLSPHETLEIFRKSCNGTQPPGRGCKECSVQ